MCPLNLASFVQRPRRWGRLGTAHAGGCTVPVCGWAPTDCSEEATAQPCSKPESCKLSSCVRACVHSFTASESPPPGSSHLGLRNWEHHTLANDSGQIFTGDPVTVTMGGNPNVFVDSEQGPEATTPADPVRSAASRSCRAALPHSSWRPCPARAAHSWRSGVYKWPAHRVLDQGLARE